MMKKWMIGIAETLRNNGLVFLVFVVVVGIVCMTGWKWSLETAQQMLGGDSIREAYQTEHQDPDMEYDEEVSLSDEVYVEIREGQEYLLAPSGEVLFGPCRYIYGDLGRFTYRDIFRYVDENGLIGFAKVEDTGTVTVLCEGTFSEAGMMSDGSACVAEGDDLYYIDDTGKRFTTGTYLETYPFEESQGVYARVKKTDGSWSVINRREEEVLSGFGMINELPYVTALGTGIRDGKAVVFSLEPAENLSARILFEFEEYTEISAPYSAGELAFVTSREGRQGVIRLWDGSVVVPAEYEEIQHMYTGAESDEEQMCFLCRKTDGTYDVRYLQE